jgi:GNAT superfamily N-acetyltransferase
MSSDHLTHVVRTHLELSSPDKLRPGRSPDIVPRIKLERPSAAEYLELYSRIGEPWHWRDRLAWSDDELRRYLGDPRVRVYTANVDDENAGYFELKHHENGSIEIMYFGLDQRFTGKGLGGWLLTRAVEEAFSLGARRVMLNTCTLDAPQALPNYLARGFVITREETYTVALPSPPRATATGATGSSTS